MEVNKETNLTAESFMESLAKQLADQYHGEVKDLKITVNVPAKDETA